jgi:hypothetical protein
MPRTTYFQSPLVLQRRVGREVLITRVDYGACDSLAGTAYDAWNLLGRAQTSEQVVASLAERYKVDPGRIQQDVESLLEELVKRQWVRTLERS